MKKIAAEVPTKEFRILQIKDFINQMPWSQIGGNPPNLNTKDKTLDPQTLAAAERLREIGESLGMMSLIAGASYVNNDDLDAAANALFEAKSEVKQVLRDWDKYHKHMGSKIWTLEEKLEALSGSEFPTYFPQEWHPKNVGSYVGGNKQGEFGCTPSDPRKPGEGLCETPFYNTFLMWGPECERCGAGGKDPRYLRLKRRYPHLFVPEQVRERLLGRKRPFFIPSPGLEGYRKPPAPGTIYKNMHDADKLDQEVRQEGFKFLDADDERDYWDFLKAFNQFKAQEMEKAETVSYIASYFEKFPYKKKKFEHRHGPSFLDPSKLGSGKMTTDEGALLKIATEFNKLAVGKAELAQSIAKFFSPEKVPFWRPTNIRGYPAIVFVMQKDESVERNLAAHLNKELSINVFVLTGAGITV